MKNRSPQKHRWTSRDSEELYLVRSWAQGYFNVGVGGALQVTPRGPDGPSLDLHELVCDLVERGLGTPLLLRFGGILEDRIRSIHRAFAKAITVESYRGSYRTVFPVKVNQQRQVVDEVLNFGRAVGIGLEAGSKPEVMIALAKQSDPESMLVCNGVKDREYIELAMLAAKLGRRTIIVIDRLEELQLCIEAAREFDVRPALGVRARLATRGAGKWVESTGDRSKFGLATFELLEAVQRLEQEGLLDCLEMLHFHIGSQITDIRAIKSALREASRIYVELCSLGAPMGMFDVGGGLGVDYDGSRTDFHSSMNYTLQEYANDVVWAVQTACDEKDLPHPEIVSESGRAISAHHSVLVTDVIGRTTMPIENGTKPPGGEAPLPVQELWRVLQDVTVKNAFESYHDALQLKEEALNAFNLGYLGIEARARCERLFWSTCHRILECLRHEGELPEELASLPSRLSDIYYCNWSAFQSTPDHWAVKQLFPVMPIHRLDERPTRRGVLADLTCDSDGKMDRFIDLKGVADYLDLHDPMGQPYYIGMFLIGAYQEVLGDLHNLFGDTNAVHVSLDDQGHVVIDEVIEGDRVDEVLHYVQYSSEQLMRQMRKHIERALRDKRLTLEQSRVLMRDYEAGLKGYTYLE
ncbi:MAG: biosynthetic arginine decarboxylase [Planctomycetota bacterium]|nr:biosynthetic arginine decarboxylase [Planctomycetota bacterium]